MTRLGCVPLLHHAEMLLILLTVWISTSVLVAATRIALHLSSATAACTPAEQSWLPRLQRVHHAHFAAAVGVILVVDALWDLVRNLTFQVRDEARNISLEGLYGQGCASVCVTTD